MSEKVRKEPIPYRDDVSAMGLKENFERAIKEVKARLLIREVIADALMLAPCGVFLATTRFTHLGQAIFAMVPAALIIGMRTFDLAQDRRRIQSLLAMRDRILPGKVEEVDELAVQRVEKSLDTTYLKRNVTMGFSIASGTLMVVTAFTLDNNWGSFVTFVAAAILTGMVNGLDATTVEIGEEFKVKMKEILAYVGKEREIPEMDLALPAPAKETRSGVRVDAQGEAKATGSDEDDVEAAKRRRKAG